MNKVKIVDILEFLENKKIPYVFEGNSNTVIEGFSSLLQYKSGSITWVKNMDVLANADIRKKEIVSAVVQEGIGIDIKNQIISKESKHAFFSILEEFFGNKKTFDRIGQGTYISPDVKLGNNVRIGHNCTLDGDITIGDNTIVHNNVNMINNITIGKNCEIQSGVSIGHDGFSYTEIDGFKHMVKHYGGVIIGDDVTIGVNTAITRGTIDDTVIGDNCKINNLCQISHNNFFERGITVIPGTIFMGSVTVGENSYISTSMIRNQIKIGEKAFVGMGSVVTKDVNANSVVIGVPAKEWNKE